MTTTKPTFNIKRGEVYYINESPQTPSIGHEIWSNRAGIIVSNDVFNARSGVALIVYLNSNRNQTQSPTHVHVKCKGKQVVAMCEQIHTVDITRIDDQMDTLTEDEMNQVEQALMFALQINPTNSPQGIFKKWEKYIHTLSLPVNGETIDPMQEIGRLKEYVRLLEQDVQSYKNLYKTAQAKLTMHTSCKPDTSSN